MPNRKKNAPSCGNTNGASKKKYHQNYTPSFPTKQDRTADFMRYISLALPVPVMTVTEN